MITATARPVEVVERWTLAESVTPPNFAGEISGDLEPASPQLLAIAEELRQERWAEYATYRRPLPAIVEPPEIKPTSSAKRRARRRRREAKRREIRHQRKVFEILQRQPLCDGCGNEMRLGESWAARPNLLLTGGLICSECGIDRPEDLVQA